MTAIVALTIQAEDGPETVQAQPATPGLYVYKVPTTVDVGAPCRWRLGHHTGLQVARFRTAEQAHAAAAAVADWATWTDGPDVVQKRCTGPGSDPWAMRDLIDHIEGAGGHLGNCAHPNDDGN